jgi:RNA 3'-terminal phosphate cyclase (ATP)
MIEVDGSQGEGGGQVLRTSLSLAALAGFPLRIVNIRAGRKKPGLRKQHLTAVSATAEIVSAEVAGASLGSQELTFTPQKPQGGEYVFDIGTAGSTCLVFQTILWPLLFAQQESRVELIGGTHNPMAPSFDFLARTFLPLLSRMGAQVSLQLKKHGFYPKGGGRLIAEISPLRTLQPIALPAIAGDHAPSLQARVISSRLPEHVATRELRLATEALDLPAASAEVVKVKKSLSPANVFFLHAERGGICETITSFGERGLPAERVVEQALAEMKRYLSYPVRVGEYLADQLIIPLALAGGGSFSTMPLSLHCQTNIALVQKLMSVSIATNKAAHGGVDVSFSSAG